MKPVHQANVAASANKRGHIPVKVPTAKSTIAKPATARASDVRDVNAAGTARWGAGAASGERAAGRSWSAAANELRQEAPQRQQDEPQMEQERQTMSFSARFHTNRAAMNRYKLQDAGDFPTLATPEPVEEEKKPVKPEPKPAPVKEPAPVPKRKEASSSGFSWADISEDPEAGWMADDIMDRIKGEVAPVPSTNMWEERAKASAAETHPKTSSTAETRSKAETPKAEKPKVQKAKEVQERKKSSEERESRPPVDRAAAAEARRKQADEALQKRERLLKNREEQPRGRETTGRGLRGGASAEEASRRRAAEIKKIADEHQRLLAEDKRRQEEYLKKQAAAKAEYDAKFAEEKAKRDAERAKALQEQEEQARAELEAVAQQKDYMANLAREAEKRRREEEERIERETKERIAEKLRQLEERSKQKQVEEKQRKAEERAEREASRKELESRKREQEICRRSSVDRQSDERRSNERHYERTIDDRPSGYSERKDRGPPISVIEDDGREWRRRPRETFQPKRAQFSAHGGVRIQKRESPSSDRSASENGERGSSRGRKAALVVDVQVRKVPQQASLPASHEGKAKKKHKSARILSVHVFRVPRGQTRAQAESIAAEEGIGGPSSLQWAAPPPSSGMSESQAKQAAFSAIAPGGFSQQPQAVPQRYEALRPPMADGQAQPQQAYPRGHTFVQYQTQPGSPVLWNAHRPATPQAENDHDDEASIQPQWSLPIAQAHIGVEQGASTQEGGRKKKRSKRKKKQRGAAGDEAAASDTSAQQGSAQAPDGGDSSSQKKRRRRGGKGNRRKKPQGGGADGPADGASPAAHTAPSSGSAPAPPVGTN